MGESNEEGEGSEGRRVGGYIERKGGVGEGDGEEGRNGGGGGKGGKGRSGKEK